MEYSNYKEHYELDSRQILGPDEMSKYQRAAQKRRIETVIRNIPLIPGGRILDVGTGSGWLSSELVKCSSRPVSMDMGFYGLKRTAKRFPELTLMAGDVYYPPFCPRSFEGIILSEVLEHLADPADALSGLSKLLKKDGWLLITVPYREQIHQTLCIHCNRLTPVDAHLHSFDMPSLKEIAFKAGLSSVRMFPFMDSGLERLGFARMTAICPYLFWRTIDRAMVSLKNRPSYLFALFRRI